MSSRQQLESILCSVPFVAALGVGVEECRPGDVVLRLPAKSENTAHGGTIHTGAMFTVGELAASIALGSHPALASLVHLQKASRIVYMRASGSDVTAHATVTSDIVDAVERSVAESGRTQLELPVKIMDGHGTDLAEVVVLFNLRRP